MLFSIVIVNWNSGSYLRHCISSIAMSSKELLSISEVIVVDNASVDDSTLGIEGLGITVRVVNNDINVGFASACNQGAQNATGQYFLFLNPDAALYPKTLEICLTFMRDPANSRVGICGVQLLDSAGHVSRSCARFPSVVRFVAMSAGIDRIFPLRGITMREWDHTCTREVDQVIGAFFLVRRELFVALAGFDERFFVYFEEVDFSRRARMAGWASVYLVAAQAFHAGGGTTNQIKARRLYFSWRSRLIYSFNHFSWGGAIIVLVTTLLVEPFARTALALAHSSWSGLRETWTGYFMLLYWLPHWILRGVTR